MGIIAWPFLPSVGPSRAGHSQSSNPHLSFPAGVRPPTSQSRFSPPTPAPSPPSPTGIAQKTEVPYLLTSCFGHGPTMTTEFTVVIETMQASVSTGGGKR